MRRSDGAVREALDALGKRRLALGIHDLSFPSDPDHDTGRGSPYSRAGLDFARFVAELGFDGLQLGPLGETTQGRPSPYDGAIFAHSPLTVALDRLVDGDGEWRGLLDRAALEAVVAARPPGAEQRVPNGFVEREHRRLLRRAWQAFRERDDPALRARLQAFLAREAAWLERDTLFDALLAEHGGAPPRYWSGPGAELDGRLFAPLPGEEAACASRLEALREKHAAEIGWSGFVQFVAHEQHQAFRTALHAEGLELLGDLPIGCGERDAWSYAALFLRDYVMGAPPSRTNPEGQAWHYPVLDPAQYGTLERPGPALRLLVERVDKMFHEFDGVRIDHPHGLVCPWVYRRAAPDPAEAVQQGARLFASPDLPDHPALARYARVGRDDLARDPDTPRHADDWVARLAPDAVARYSLLFDAVVETARRHGRGAPDLICEVLSTLPHPLAGVMARHGLGRFRITQKANVHDPSDVYRSENAAPEDWILAGSHDTRPLWARIEEWRTTGELADRARYLAVRLERDERRRGDFARSLVRDPGLFAHAQFADLFASPARQVMIYVTDLFGSTESFNRPGTVSASNWSLRVPGDYRSLHRERAAARRALHLPLALLLALRARGDARTAGLERRLEAETRMAPERTDLAAGRDAERA